MSSGIIYVMSTAVSGLIKIGQTQTEQFENRMRFLENNGYANITGLKREFAIEVEDYQSKEKLIHTIFDKSQVGMSELFVTDIDVVIQLLSSFDGKQIYPENRKKEEVFEEVTKEIEDKKYVSLIPDGEYYLERKVKGFGKVKGKMKVEKGVLIVLKGSVCAPVGNQTEPPIRKKVDIKNNILQEDVPCKSPSTAGDIILSMSNNGWVEWKDKYGNPINDFRKNNKF